MGGLRQRLEARPGHRVAGRSAVLHRDRQLLPGGAAGRERGVVALDADADVPADELEVAVPAQRASDYVAKRATKGEPKVSYPLGSKSVDLRAMLPPHPPIRVQRWSLRRVLLAVATFGGMVLVLLLLALL